MILAESLKHWKSASFKDVFRSELLSLDTTFLPLHLATNQGGHVDYSSIGLTILSTSEDENFVNVKTGIFFTEIVGGCNCDDDPSEANSYCILLINIHKTTAKCAFSLLTE